MAVTVRVRVRVGVRGCVCGCVVVAVRVSVPTSGCGRQSAGVRMWMSGETVWV